MADQYKKSSSGTGRENGAESEKLTSPASQTFDQTYPPDLRQVEDRLLERRRKGQTRPAASRVGLAFSGGGIRSATFCLGVLQSLAKANLLGRIDYLSTVSGGGYAGSFLTRLFSRDFVSSLDDAQNRLNSATQPIAPGRLDPIEWLRQNSRYLAPKGGDMMLDVAVVLRNWISLQVVLLSFLLMLFVVLQTARIAVDLALESMLAPAGPAAGASWVLQALGLHQSLDHLTGFICWSPWINLLPPWLLLAVVPCGWAYWMIGYVHGPERVRSAESTLSWLWRNAWRIELHPLYGLFAVIACGAVLVFKAGPAGTLIGALALLASLFTFALFLIILLPQLPAGNSGGRLRELSSYLYGAMAWWRDVDVAGLPVAEQDKQRLEIDASARSACTKTLSWALQAWLLFALLCLIDSLGQTLYAWLRSDHNTSAFIGTGIGAAVSAMLAVGTRMSSSSGFLGRFIGNLGPGIYLRLLSSAAAALIVVVVLGACDTASHAIAWQLQELPVRTAAATPVHFYEHSSCGDLCACLLAFLVLLLFSVLFGHAWAFLNRSSYHPLYRDRLTRAYLGASNRKRAEPGQGAITDPIPDDDTMCAECWSDDIIDKGMPLQLLNVTINETSSARGKTVFRDRKGIGMAIGPAGLSAGATHHALFGRDGNPPDPVPLDHPDDGTLCPLVVDGGYSMFGKNGERLPAERLSLGQWMAISGAAFSTGMGYHTTLALSLLTGFANVRLGYWWNSGVNPAHRSNTRRAWRPLARSMRFMFPVQNYLFSELTARFRGPDAPHWYLSDGGSFENMGGYELIRRRLPAMVIVDGEEDPDYTYEGLANLVRKARMDFGAEISFLNKAQILKLNMPDDIAACFDHPDCLRPDKDGFSSAHAAIASVAYAAPDKPPRSVLIYLKPTLKHDVPADLREYQLKNAPFPNQPTFDQFFDEAQWESYRRLGEYIAGKIFLDPVNAAAPAAANWRPHLLIPPPDELLGQT